MPPNEKANENANENANQPATPTAQPASPPEKLPNANAAWSASKRNRDLNVDAVMELIAAQVNAAIDEGKFEANMTMRSIGLPSGPLPGRIRSTLINAGYTVTMRGRDYLLVDWRSAGGEG